MFFRSMVAAPLLAALSAASVPAQAASRATAITPEKLRPHIEILASDAYEGRKPGTAAENKTLLYISTQFARLGLQPAGVDGSWYQPVPLVRRKAFVHRAIFRSRSGTLPLDAENLILVGREPMEALRDAPVLFAGHVLDFTASDVRGAVLLMPYSGPKEAPSFSKRSQAAVAAGAGAVIALFPSDVPWSAVEGAYRGGSDGLQSESVASIRGAMPVAAAARLLSDAGQDFDALLASSGREGFRPVPIPIRADLDVSTEVRKYVSHNVIGRLRGTGGSDETVLYLGHWDHLGICRPDHPTDKICNGAVDNASGIAMLIEIAAALARGKKPQRDILFMATTAEEMGLLGAEHFGAQATVPLKKIVAALNIDTVAIHEAGSPVAVIGRGTAPLDAVIAASAAELGRKMDDDGEADAFVSRQDGWALTRAGVPTVMVGGSFSDMKQLNAFLSGPYHKAEDDLGRPLILGGAAEDADLLVALGRKLADPKIYQPPVR